MMYVRGNAYDYDHWAALGNDGWNYRAVLPYFKKSTSGTRRVGLSRRGRSAQRRRPAGAAHDHPRGWIAAAQDIGIAANIDFNGESQEGVGLGQETTIGGKRCSAAIAFLHPVMARENLTVETTSLVTRVLLDGTRATGVAYVQNGAMHESRADREVILCGGAVNSPQLLMLSGIGAARHLGEVGIPVSLDLPGVGRNLQDHLSATIDYRSRQAGDIPGIVDLRPGRLFRQQPTRPSGARSPDHFRGVAGRAARRSADLLVDPDTATPGKPRNDPPGLGRSVCSTPHSAAVLVGGGRSRRTRRGGQDRPSDRRGAGAGRRLDAETVPGSWLQSDDAIGSFVRERASTGSTRWARARWEPTHWRSSTTGSGFTPSSGSGSWMPRSCRRSSAATRMRPS